MPDPGQRWFTFLCTHAQAMVACDFFVVVTARFRILYVFVFMELWRRRILHVNVTDHPSADWTQKGPAATLHKPDFQAELLALRYQTHFLNPAVQLTTTFRGGVDAVAVFVLTRKRFPSAVTSYWNITLFTPPARTCASNSGTGAPGSK